MAKKTRPIMPFPLRLRPALRRRLEALARADHRTLTNYLLSVLERHVEDAERARKVETFKTYERDD
jgi:predicted DNA-binding protein